MKLDECEKEYARDIALFFFGLALVLFFIFWIERIDNPPEPELIDHCIPEIESTRERAK